MSTAPSAPTDPYDAARWLLARHPWPAALVRRVVGDGPGWVEDLSRAWQDLDRWRHDWDAWNQTHPEPSWAAPEPVWDAWDQDGPRPTPAALAISVLSSGEQEVLRLLATLNTLTDLPTGDPRGVALTLDWVRLVLARCTWDPQGRAAYDAICEEER